MPRKKAPLAELSLEVLEEYGANIAVVHAVLLHACTKNSNTVTIKREWLSKKSCMSLRTLDRVLKKMEELELITRKKNSRASTYTIKEID